MDSEEERKRFPEHKWIVNLQRYISNLYHSARLLDELCDELTKRRYLIQKYERRITNCNKGINCKSVICPYFHSTADKKLIQQNKENEDDYSFYKDKFFQLFERIKPFLIDDVACIVRDYCCVQFAQMTKEGLIITDVNYNHRLFAPSRCAGIFICFCSFTNKRPNSYYLLSKDVSHYELHKECFLKYFGKKPNLNGWELSVWRK